MGFIRLGFIDVILSKALLRGFVTAVAIVITMYVHFSLGLVFENDAGCREQLIPMVGLSGLEQQENPTTTPDKFMFLVTHLSQANRATTILSFSTLFLLVGIRTLKRRYSPTYHLVFFIPEIFIAVVLSTALSQAYRWDKHGVSILGDVALSKDDSYFDFPLTENNLTWLKSTTPTAMSVAIP